jgi:hypothetical protein
MTLRAGVVWVTMSFNSGVLWAVRIHRGSNMSQILIDLRSHANSYRNSIALLMLLTMLMPLLVVLIMILLVPLVLRSFYLWKPQDSCLEFKMSKLCKTHINKCPQICQIIKPITQYVQNTCSTNVTDIISQIMTLNICSAYFPHLFGFSANFLLFFRNSYLFRMFYAMCMVSAFVPQFPAILNHSALFLQFQSCFPQLWFRPNAFQFSRFPNLVRNVPAFVPQFVRMCFAILNCSAISPQCVGFGSVILVSAQRVFSAFVLQFLIFLYFLRIVRAIIINGKIPCCP